MFGQEAHVLSLLGKSYHHDLTIPGTCLSSRNVVLILRKTVPDFARILGCNFVMASLKDIASDLAFLTHNVHVVVPKLPAHLAFFCIGWRLRDASHLLCPYPSLQAPAQPRFVTLISIITPNFATHASGFIRTSSLPPPLHATSGSHIHL